MARKQRTRRANGEGSTFQDAAGVWHTQFSLPDGRRVRRRAKSQAEAREKLRQLQREHAAGVLLGKKQPTVSEWCAIWLAEFATNLRPNIREQYRGIVKAHIDSAPLGKRQLDKLTPADVQRWVNELKGKAAPKTVRNAHARLRKALAVAEQQGYISRNVAAGIQLPPSSDAEIQPLDFTQARALLVAFADHRLYALYRLALGLGMRQAELLGLTWDCIDLSAKTLTVKQQLRRVPSSTGCKVFVLQPTKTKAGTRTLALDADLIAVLRAHRANQAEEYLLLGERYRDPFVSERGGLVFTTETGGPLFGGLVVRPFKAALKRIGLPGSTRFHDLRHTAATLMLADGVPLVTVSKVLGHSSPAITASIYAHALDENKASAIASLSARLRIGNSPA
jgi:integrase